MILRICRRLLAGLVLSFAGVSVLAQGQANLFQSDLKPLRATIKAGQKEAAPGDSVEVVVQVRLNKGYHIYAAGDTNSLNIPTTVSLALPKGLTAVGDWTNAPPAAPSKEGPIFTNTVAFHRTVKVAADAPHQTMTIAATLSYQACNDTACYPPDTLALETPLTIVDKLNPVSK